MENDYINVGIYTGIISQPDNRWRGRDEGNIQCIIPMCFYIVGSAMVLGKTRLYQNVGKTFKVCKSKIYFKISQCKIDRYTNIINKEKNRIVSSEQVSIYKTLFISIE